VTSRGAGGGGSSYASPQASNATFGLDATRTPQVTITADTKPIPTPPLALTELRVSPSSSVLTGRRTGGQCRPLTPTNAKHHHCRRSIALHISYELNEPGTVTFAISQKLPGRLVAGRCVAPTRSNRARRRCTRLISLHGTIVKTGRAGANSFVFTGRIGDRVLGPGSYVVTAAPSSANGIGAQQSTPFRIRA
jgi:hypothetical protein